MDITQELRDALERAYHAFSEFPCPTHLETSPLRDGNAILRTLRSAPLRKLEGEKIGPYAGWALTTAGSADDYMHFLPRILDLAVHQPRWMGLDPPVIASKLRRAQWHGWPSNRRNAVVDVFQSAFHWTLELHTDESSSAPDWMCGLVGLGVAVEGLLTIWRQSPSLNAVLQLASFSSMLDVLLTDDGSATFWSDVDMPTRLTLAAWLKSKETNTVLLSALDRVEQEDRWQIEQALKSLRTASN